MGALVVEVVEVCERLYKIAEEKGEPTTSYDSERSEGENVGYGSRHDRTHYTLQDEPFAIKATKDSWVRWNPTADWNGTTRSLELLCNGKKIFEAMCDGTKRVQRFTAGDERYAGSKTEEAKSWMVLYGDPKNLPAKYLKAAI